MSQPLPRLINLGETIDQNGYPGMIKQMRDQACQVNGYWNFNRELISVDEAQRLCQSNPDIVVSQQWRLIGTFQDLISLAKLAGYTHQPNLNEETYWINSLQIVKLCESLNRPCQIWQELLNNSNHTCCKCSDQRQSRYQIPSSPQTLITIPSFSVVPSTQAKTTQPAVVVRSGLASTRSPLKYTSLPPPPTPRPVPELFCQLDPNKSPLPGQLSPIKILSAGQTPMPGQLTPVQTKQ